MLSNTARADDGDWLGLGDVLKEWFWAFVNTIFSIFLNGLDWLTATITNSIPEGVKTGLAAVADYYAVANIWLPLDFALQLVAAYLAIYVICVPVRVLIKVL